MISVLKFTFYIINQISIIILHPIRLVFLIFKIKYCLTEVLEQPGGVTSTHNVMVICDQRHPKVSKQRTLLPWKLKCLYWDRERNKSCASCLASGKCRSTY